MNRQALILGGGIGGLGVAECLRDLLPDGDRVTIVEPTLERTLGLSLLWVMRGWREPDQVRFTPAIFDRPGVEVVNANADEIDLGRRMVRAGAHALRYDALVVALGAQLDATLLPGLPEAIQAGSAGDCYTPEGAMWLRERLDHLERGRVCVLIPRAPFQCPAAPYEFAFLIDDKLTETGARDAVQLDIYTTEAQPMPSAGPAVGEALLALLDERRIAFHPGTTVQWIEPESRQLVLAGGERPSFDLLVAVPPHAPPWPVVDAGFGDAGWIRVDARSLATRVEGVWAVGDVALIRLANGLALPKAAVFALGQVPAVATGVARHLGCDTPVQQFSGEGYCWVELGGGRAAKGVGSFLESPGPIVELYGPSREYHVEKEDEERDLIAQLTATEPWEETADVNGK